MSTASQIVQVPVFELVEANIGRHYWDVKKQVISNTEILDRLKTFLKSSKKFLSGGFGYTIQVHSDVASLKDAEFMFAIMAKILVALNNKVYFVSESEVMDIYAATFSKDPEAMPILKNMMSVDALFIHSVTGADHKKFSAEAMTKIFKSRRDSQKSTFVATSLSEKEFKNYFSARAWEFLVELSPPIEVVELL